MSFRSGLSVFIVFWTLLGIAGNVHVLCAEENQDWVSLEKATDFPDSYSSAFVDSLASRKNTTFSKSLRSIPSSAFSLGEKFVFDVSWGPITAGYAILEAKPDSTNKTLILYGKGMTNSFFSSFYKVRDVIKATMDKDGIYPFFFEQHLREGRYKADRWELFDQNKKVVYTYRLPPDSIPVPPFVQDYFTMIYYVRSQSFSVGDSFTFNCFADTKSYHLVLYCTKRVTVTVDCGTFNCLLVKPVLVGEGRVFTKKDEILLWVTDDKFRMPVMIKAKIKVGSITAHLLSYERKE